MVSKIDEDAEQIAFGPMGDTLPSSWTATVDYSQAAVVVELSCRYTGTGRVRLPSVKVLGKDGHSVTPQDLTTLELAAVVHEAARGLVSPGDGIHLAPRSGVRATPEELRLVAAVYWAHYVTWGSPRQAVMALWSLPRSTANYWLRKARELHNMPEAE